MRLISTERGIHFEIVRNDSSDPCSACSIRAAVNTSFGNFSGENTAVHFSGFDTFIRSFDEFLKTRLGEVTLDMTEDCALTFFRWNAKGDVGVRFAVSRYIRLGDPAKSCQVVLRGEFPLDANTSCSCPGSCRSWSMPDTQIRTATDA